MPRRFLRVAFSDNAYVLSANAEVFSAGAVPLGQCRSAFRGIKKAENLNDFLPIWYWVGESNSHCKIENLEY